MRTWPDWNAPWTVPLYNAEVCSPAKKSLPPTLPPKALVMVAFPFGVPDRNTRGSSGEGGENGTTCTHGGGDGSVDAPTLTNVYAPFARGLARQFERIISGAVVGTVTSLGMILIRFARICGKDAGEMRGRS